MRKKGQTILEYTVVMIIIISVLIVMQTYVKRGIQGRWKSATDDFGDQYDPQNVNSLVNYTTAVNALSTVVVVNGTSPEDVPGMWTNRVDTSNTVETKSGYTQVGF